jgi:hypothetical protein
MDADITNKLEEILVLLKTKKETVKIEDTKIVESEKLPEKEDKIVETKVKREPEIEHKITIETLDNLYDDSKFIQGFMYALLIVFSFIIWFKLFTLYIESKMSFN